MSIRNIDKETYKSLKNDYKLAKANNLSPEETKKLKALWKGSKYAKKLRTRKFIWVASYAVLSTLTSVSTIVRSYYVNQDSSHNKPQTENQQTS